SAAIGASTETDSGTVLPFSAISGNTIEILPSVVVLPPVNLAIWSAASFAAADARSSSPMNVSAAPDTPSARASRRDSCRMDNSSEWSSWSGTRSRRADHSHGQLLVQIIFRKKNIRPVHPVWESSARHRFQIVKKTFALIGFFPHVTKHGEEVFGKHITGRARHFTFSRRRGFEHCGIFAKELKCRRETHAIFGSQLLFRELRPVEVGDLSRSDNIKLQDFKVRLHIVRYSRLREIDKMRFLAIRTASEFPHDHKALALLAGSFEIVTKIKKAFQKPGLLVEAVVREDRLFRARACSDK